jgi:tRNA pseudouridine55 synthase
MKEEAVNIYGDGQVLLINKPLHWTSFDVVKRIRKWANVKKVGHAGTLDPLATGLLIICTGKFTKRLNEFMASEKEYEGEFTLGATTASYDLETELQNLKDPSGIKQEEIYKATKKFTGETWQIPPAYSAIKKAGKRAYARVRNGEEIKLDPRKIFIKEFEITGIESTIVRFRVVCAAGVYIRSLVHDMGAQLGCGAYLSSLCRTRIGDFLLNQSLTIEDAENEIRSKLRDQKG